MKYLLSIFSVFSTVRCAELLASTKLLQALSCVQNGDCGDDGRLHTVLATKEYQQIAKKVQDLLDKYETTVTPVYGRRLLADFYDELRDIYNLFHAKKTTTTTTPTNGNGRRLFDVQVHDDIMHVLESLVRKKTTTTTTTAAPTTTPPPPPPFRRLMDVAFLEDLANVLARLHYKKTTTTTTTTPGNGRRLFGVQVYDDIIHVLESLFGKKTTTTTAAPTTTTTTAPTTTTAAPTTTTAAPTTTPPPPPPFRRLMDAAFLEDLANVLARLHYKKTTTTTTTTPWGRRLFDVQVHDDIMHVLESLVRKKKRTTTTTTTPPPPPVRRLAESEDVLNGFVKQMEHAIGQLSTADLTGVASGDMSDISRRLADVDIAAFAEEIKAALSGKPYDGTFSAGQWEQFAQQMKSLIGQEAVDLF